MSKSVVSFDVFLSHSGADKPWVRKLKAALEARGLTVWLDEEQIAPGDLLVDAMETGIESSRTVVIVVSPEAVASGWVKEEYSRALALSVDKGHELRLIPVLLRTCPKTTSEFCGRILLSILTQEEQVDATKTRSPM